MNDGSGDDDDEPEPATQCATRRTERWTMVRPDVLFDKNHAIGRQIGVHKICDVLKKEKLDKTKSVYIYEWEQ